MLKNSAVRVLFAMLLAFTVSSFIYFSFVNFYSAKIINHEAFLAQFGNGVYQYRVLGTYLLLKIYDFLGQMHINYTKLPLKLMDAHVQPGMYLAFYILNTAFGIAAAGAMAILAEDRAFRLSNTEKVLVVATGVFVICITQFVIVPYDNSGYFLMMVFFIFLLRYLSKPGPGGMFVLTIIIMLSAANRESAALSLSLAATLFIEKWGVGRRTIKALLPLGIGFFVVYMGLRVLHKSFATNDGSLLLENFSKAKNLLGLLFWLVFFLFTILISLDRRSLRRVLLFHLFSLPYIGMCFYSGILYEARLYMPLFLTSLFISRLEINPKAENLA